MGKILDILLKTRFRTGISIGIVILLLSLLIPDIFLHKCTFVKLIWPPKLREYLPPMCSGGLDANFLDVITECTTKATEARKDLFIASLVRHLVVESVHDTGITYSTNDYYTLYYLKQNDKGYPVEMKTAQNRITFSDIKVADPIQPKSINPDSVSISILPSLTCNLHPLFFHNKNVINPGLKQRKELGLELGPKEILNAIGEDEYFIGAITFIFDSNFPNVQIRDSAIYHWRLNDPAPSEQILLTQFAGSNNQIRNLPVFRSKRPLEPREMLGMVIKWE